MPELTVNYTRYKNAAKPTDNSRHKGLRKGVIEFLKAEPCLGNKYMISLLHVPYSCLNSFLFCDPA